MQNDLFSFATTPTAIEMAKAHPDKFSEEFLEWLPANPHIFWAFECEALKIIDRGFKHYSSYTIVEFLRHHTALSEEGSEFKINNNMRPYLARLFALFHPQHADLFEYRVTTKKKGIEA